MGRDYVAENIEQSSLAIAEWLKTEFPGTTLEYRHLDTDYQIEGPGISKWELDEGKDVILYRIQGDPARYELAVTVIALEDHPVGQIIDRLSARNVGDMLRRNPGRRIIVGRTLKATVLQ